MPVVDPIVNTDPSDGSVVYASAADAARYGFELTGAELELALRSAELYVDDLLGPLPVNPDTGLKLRPESLYVWEREVLARAVVLQAKTDYAAQQAGDAAAAVAAQNDGRGPIVEEQGPDFRVKYAGGSSSSGASSSSSVRLAPAVAQELRRINHLRGLTGRAL